MPSPFPGMNPYLEQRSIWHDIHEALLPAIREELARQVRPHFFVRINEHTFFHEQVLLPSVEDDRNSFLEICDRSDQRVVTVIEVLSPANKRPGPDREQYIAKRSELCRNFVNFVELDLLRGGPRMPMENLPRCDYYAMVSRWRQRPSAGVWPIGLREPLPNIPIPLDGPHPDAVLELQAVLHRVYDAAGYEDYIYRTAPDPELGQEDRDWAKQFVPV